MDNLLIPFAKEHLKTQSVMQVYIIIKIFARRLEMDTSMGYWIPKLTELKEEVEREKDVNVPEAVAKQTAKKPIVKEGYRYCPNCGRD